MEGENKVLKGLGDRLTEENTGVECHQCVVSLNPGC